MIQIRPVSDLRNKFPEIEEIVQKRDEPVFLTKNGYGTMVVMSLGRYSSLTEESNPVWDEAGRKAGIAQSVEDGIRAAELAVQNGDTLCVSGEEAFAGWRRKLNEWKNEV